MSSCIRMLLLVACVLSLGTPQVDTRARVAPPLPARCDSSAMESSDAGCAAHPGGSPSRSDAIAVAEPELRTKSAAPRSAAPVFGALHGGERLVAPRVTAFASVGHSRAALHRHPTLFVLRC